MQSVHCHRASKRGVRTREQPPPPPNGCPERPCDRSTRSASCTLWRRGSECGPCRQRVPDVLPPRDPRRQGATHLLRFLSSLRGRHGAHAGPRERTRTTDGCSSLLAAPKVAHQTPRNFLPAYASSSSSPSAPSVGSPSPSPGGSRSPLGEAPTRLPKERLRFGGRVKVTSSAVGSSASPPPMSSKAPAPAVAKCAPPEQSLSSISVHNSAGAGPLTPPIAGVGGWLGRWRVCAAIEGGE